MRTSPRVRPSLDWPGKREAQPDAAPARSTIDALEVLEVHGEAAAGGAAWRNKLVLGDNRRAIPALLGEFTGKVDLVYIDPPFGTGGDFTVHGRAPEDGALVAYTDRWGEGLGDYLSTMLEQLELIRALLSERGTVFVHCDWRVSHYLRCLLDEVFGPEAFKNEIVWRYRRWPSRTRAFQKMHDVLLWYGKGRGDGHAWTQLYEPLAPSTLETWGTKRQVADFSTGRRRPSQTDEETRGAPMADVWDIGIIAPIARERVGYPTQKPEALLRRVIEAASRPGDLVADLFVGSGTTLAVAEKLGRRWVGCDVGPIAIHTTRKRLLGLRAEAVERAEDARPAFEILGEATLGPSRPGVSAAVELDDPHAPPAGEERSGRAARVRLASGDEARSVVDFWSVDWDYQGGPLRSLFHAFRGKHRGALPLEATHRYITAGTYRIAVQVIDAAGAETRQVLTACVR
jgi:DNA modification methylase